MRLLILVTAFIVLSSAAGAQQTCVTRADGSYNCTTTTSSGGQSTTTVSSNTHRTFEPDATGLLRVPTQDGEILYHCDNIGPCKQIGLNPPPLNRQ